MEIVKVQRPLVQSPGQDMWLIYDKARKHQTMVPVGVIPDHVKIAFENDTKGYFNGAWSSIVGWGLSERVAAQEW